MLTNAVAWTLVAQQGGPGSMWPALIIIFVLFYFMLIRPERQKQKEHKSMLEGLKKNDRIITLGGVYGVVTNVNREADEVTLKVDEANNTKIRVTFGSIGRVLTAGDEESKA